LWQDGLEILVHDPDVQLDRMLGSNREYLERQLPQINQILCTRMGDMLSKCDAVVVSQKRQEFTTALQALNGRAVILDLTRSSEERFLPDVSRDRGISW